jgi:HEAT repeat protein
MKRIVLMTLCGLILSIIVHAQDNKIDVLITQLRESKDIYERRRAAKALGELEAQPREVMIGVAAALLQAVSDKDESLKFYAYEALKRVRLSAEDAVDVWVNNPVGNWLEEAAVPLLCQLLDKEKNLRIRFHIAEELIRLGPSMPNVAVDGLIKVLRNPAFRKPGNFLSGESYRMVAMALAEIGEEAVPYLLELLADPDDYVCYEASIALSLMNPPPEIIVPTLLDILASGEAHSQWAVMRVLERIGEPAKAAVPLLIDALRDRLYSHLIPRALGAIGPAAKAAVPLLIEWLDAPLPNLSKEGVAHTRSSLIDALGKIGPEAQGALPQITKALDDESDMVRAVAIPALTGIGYPLTVNELKALLDLDNKSTYLSVVKELGKRGPPFDEAIAVLIETSTSYAAVELARIGQPAVPALIEALSHPNTDIRRSAAYAFGEMESLTTDAVPALIKALAETETVHRAARGLSHIGTPEALNAVMATLKHENDQIRMRGTATLADWDPPPQEATPVLIAVLGDKYQPVHRNAVIALRKIGTVEAIKAVDRVELGLK